jgi:outer membrane protein OmpA-like peptidoglycan-associated protein
MKSLLLFLSSFLFYAPTNSQNLVANGGFEDENICSEYKKNCAPAAWIATSLWSDYYFYETQFAFSGSHCVGLSAGNISKPGVRNFLRSRLLCGLRPGHKYLLEFYIRSKYPILDSIGVYFSNIDFLYDYVYMNRDFKTVNPQLWSVNGFDSASYDPSIWQKVHLIYTANGDEGYISIGNFKRRDYTDIRHGDYKNDFYFFIDQISMTAVDTAEKICIQADSVKKSLYSDNARHSQVQLLSRFYDRRPEAQLSLPKTRMPLVQRIDTLIVPDIFFATNSYGLSSESAGLLDSLTYKLKLSIVDSVIIEGHTDNVGTFEHNKELSLNRSQSIKEYITSKIPALKEKTITRGYAFLQPVSTNKTPEGRRQNRRVEIFVYRKE